MIDHVGRSDTETPARLPDSQGTIERDGVRVHWEAYGHDGPPILLLPTWSIAHSRHWKAQIPYLSRHFRVVTFDGRGNGFSDRPPEIAAYNGTEFVADAIAVMDANGLDTVTAAGLSMGGLRALLLASAHPDRVNGAFLIGAAVPRLSPSPPDRAQYRFDEQRDSYEGWGRYNQYSWLQDYRGFLEFFWGEIFTEPHSTKQIEDGVAWGLDTTPETLIATELATSGLPDREAVEALCRSVTCPLRIVHGTNDQIVPFERSVGVADLTGGELIRIEGGGHAPTARDPVKINRLLREFADRVAGGTSAGTTWRRSITRTKRALLVSSPIGLGHAWRDVAIADELRRQVPGLDVQWLAQEPVTTVLRARGESIHPASADLASEAAHIDREAGEHDLHAFQAIRRMDEILCANFMVFDDLVREEQFDVWIGDEAWELDHFLHENPELKTAPYVWLSDFVGFLPMPAGGEHEAFLTADFNADMIELIERFPSVRDRSIFVGEPGDVVPETFGPGLPEIRAWTERHYRFSGYIPGFDPATPAEVAETRAELGVGDDPLCVISVGGSGVGGALLRRVIEAVPYAREQLPNLRVLAVAGPRIDPATLPQAEGVEVRGYVHELYRYLAACDVAVVQGGLTTTMELVAANRPFISIPLASHFEQRFHVRHRLDRYGATEWMDYEGTTPEQLAAAIVRIADTAPAYRPIEPGGAARAAAMIAELL